MKCQLLIPAAGKGVRLGSARPKALVDIAGKPLLVRTLERLQPLGLVESAVIIVSDEHRDLFASTLREAFGDCPFSFAQGGAERQISVGNGLAALAPDTDIVVIHDAARPFVPLASVRASIEAAEQCGAATVAIPSIDTVLQAEGPQPPEYDWLAATPDRRLLWACQTPQTFLVSVIRHAHELARQENFLGTDDASLVRKLGGRVRLVMGNPLNFKVTTPADLAMAERVVREGLAP